MADGTRKSSTDSSQRRESINLGKAMGSGAMGKAPKERKAKKPKERWLLTRKTWRYMTDAGRKLIPEGALNRAEDVPKIEAYFQEVCQKEPRFLLWRKGSYPGALTFRSHRKRKERKKGGSCRTKSSSADEADDIKESLSSSFASTYNTTGNKFDVQKMKYDFLNKPVASTSYKTFTKSSLSTTKEEESDENQLVNMLETYLNICQEGKKSLSQKSAIDYQELIDKLQQHLSATQGIPKTPSPLSTRKFLPESVKFEGDHVQKSLSETLSRYFSKTSSRERVVSDILTDRKLLEKLYFDLRKTKSFGSNRTGSMYMSQSKTQWRTTLTQHEEYDTDDEREKPKLEDIIRLNKSRLKSENRGTGSPPPLIEIKSSSEEKEKKKKYKDGGIQTDPVTEAVLSQCDDEYRKTLAAKEEEMKEMSKPGFRRRSSVDNEDVSQSVSDTIKRYLRMARKKSGDADKVDRFKRVNYDRNLRNIKAKGEITKPGDDDGLNKGCQTDDLWVPSYRDHKPDESLLSDPDTPFESHITSSRSSYDATTAEEYQCNNPKTNKVPSLPSSPPSGFLSTSQSFLSHLLHGKQHHDKSSPNSSANHPVTAQAAAAMQKSKSSSSVMHHGSRLVAKKIFRSRSKSQSRLQTSQCTWTPQGGCVWSSVTGKQVTLSDTSLLQLTEIERRILQKVALAKLQALNLGVTVRVPTESIGNVAHKSKRRAYLLKRKAKTTGFFDTGRKDDKDKDGSVTGLVFGIPLSQCIENDRLSRIARGGSPFRSRGELSGDENSNLRHHGSRSSFSSLIDSPRNDESGSCESLMSRERIAGSVPGLLDTLSCESTVDLANATVTEDEPGVPQLVMACCRYLENRGLHTLGIFRVSSSKKRVRQLREEFDCGKETTLDDEQCPHDVATLLKEYLRDLPDPLLCRDLYHAFVQTQRIRNRRLQLEAIQHLIQLLPVANRDTLATLLNFLACVAQHSNDIRDSTGEWIPGNKMDTNNLATVFAPNVLHCIKPGSVGKDGSDRPEDRIDVINVIRIMIDHHKQLFDVPAELLDEIYIHMMDSHPEALDQLLNKRGAAIFSYELADEPESESSSVPWSPTASSDVIIDPVLLSMHTNVDPDENQNPNEPKKTWSREEFLHEFAGMGGPNVAMKLRHRDRERGREKSSKKRWRDESGSRRKVEETGSSSISSAMTIITRIRGQKDDDSIVNQQNAKLRSSSMDSTCSVQNDNNEVNTRLLRISSDEHYVTDRRQSSPLLLDNSGVITASLKIPVQTSNQAMTLNLDDSDIPYIEDNSGYGQTFEGEKHQMTIGLVKGPTVPPRRRHRSVSGSDSSQTSYVHPITGSVSVIQSYDSAVGSSTAFSSPPHNTTPSSLGSSIAGDGALYSSPPSWASTPPTSPDSIQTSVNYIPDDFITNKNQISSRVPITTQKLQIDLSSKDLSSPILQKVSITSTSEIQQVNIPKPTDTAKDVPRKSIEVSKSGNISSLIVNKTDGKGYNVREPNISTSITNIGGAVLRSKTADFERMLSGVKTTEVKSKTVTSTTTSEKKKYTKRRYTDSRHETRHIPDSEALDKSSTTNIKTKDKPSNTTLNQSATQQTGPVYKRRELIASVPKDRHAIL